jgi:hypothetical protein
MNVALIFEFDSQARVCWEVDHYRTCNFVACNVQCTSLELKSHTSFHHDFSSRTCSRPSVSNERVKKAVVAKPRRTSIMEHWNRFDSILCPMAYRKRTQLNMFILKANLAELLC